MSRVHPLRHGLTYCAGTDTNLPLYKQKYLITIKFISFIYKRPGHQENCTPPTEIIDDPRARKGIKIFSILGGTETKLYFSSNFQ